MIDPERRGILTALNYVMRVDGLWQVWRTGERKLTDPEEIKTARRQLEIQRRLL